MPYGPYSVFDATIASFATSSSGVDLGGRAWNKVYIEIPSMTSNSQIHIQAAASASGTYRRIYLQPPNTSSVQANSFTILSSLSNGMVEIPNGHRWIKVETTAIVSFTAGFQIICSD